VDSEALLQELQALEAELHHPGSCCSRERLEQLLHPQFHEVGRSGQAYSRDTVIGYLATVTVQPAVEADQYAVTALSEDCALLTYRSAKCLADGTRSEHALRSSVWLRTAHGWQLYYHQGTPAAQSW
jgi:hypothetical protein